MNGPKRAKPRRLVLAFPPSAVPRPAIDSAAQLARLLQASLFGLLVEDADLFAAADLLFLRELDAQIRAWRPLSHEGLLEDYAAIAAALRRGLLQSAAESGVEADFAVFRGDPRTLLASGTEPSDLLALFEPITSWMSHKTETASGTIFLPRTARPQQGPVVVIAREPAAPEVEIASEIAANADNSLVVIDAAREHSSTFWLGRGQAGGTRLVGPRNLATGTRHFLQLGLPSASLVVLTRATLEWIKESLGAIAEGRSEPWLVLEER